MSEKVRLPRTGVCGGYPLDPFSSTPSLKSVCELDPAYFMLTRCSMKIPESGIARWDHVITMSAIEGIVDRFPNSSRSILLTVARLSVLQSTEKGAFSHAIRATLATLSWMWHKQGHRNNILCKPLAQLPEAALRDFALCAC